MSHTYIPPPSFLSFLVFLVDLLLVDPFIHQGVLYMNLTVLGLGALCVVVSTGCCLVVSVTSGSNSTANVAAPLVVSSHCQPFVLVVVVSCGFVVFMTGARVVFVSTFHHEGTVVGSRRGFIVVRSSL